MNRSYRIQLMAAALVAALGLLVPGTARGDVTLTITEKDGGGTQIASISVLDNQFADSTPQSGLITFAGMVGDFGIQVSTGSSNALQNVSPAVLTINNLSITGNFTGTRTLTITLEDN